MSSSPEFKEKLHRARCLAAQEQLDGCSKCCAHDIDILSFILPIEEIPESAGLQVGQELCPTCMIMLIGLADGDIKVEV